MAKEEISEKTIKEKIDAAYKWVEGWGHGSICDLRRPEETLGIAACTCERVEVLKILAELKDMAEDHYVILREQDWVVEHPLSCRLAGTMSSCFATINMLMFKDDILRDMNSATPHYRPGRYRAYFEGHTFHLDRMEER